jgi:MFS family permease
MIAARKLSYGWVVVSAAFLVTFITCGVNFSYGVFFLPIVSEFGWSRGLASVVVLVAGLTYAITMPITGIAADRYGYKWVLTISTGFLALGMALSSQIQDLWQLYLFDGLLIGLSISASFAIPVALVALWFTRRQGLAVGAATLGVSLGTALIPLAITYLISTAGWRTTFLIAGIAVAVICIPAALLMRRPTAAETMALSADGQPEPAQAGPETREDAYTGLTLSQALRTSQFWMLFLVFLFFLLSLGLVMLHMIPYAVDSGLTPVQAATLLTLIGVCGIAGRLTSGMISDRVGVKPVIIFCLLTLAAITTWIAFSRQESTFYLFAAIWGIAYSGFVTMMVRIVRQVFGIQALGSIFGALFVSDGIGFGVGPWIAGYVFDVTGSYQYSFIAVAAGLVAAVVLTIVVKPAVRQPS